MSLNSFTPAPIAHVVYHSHCADGMGAALAFDYWMDSKYELGVSYQPMSYGEVLKEPSYHNGCDLYILDFSFPPEELTEYAAWYKNVVLIDHHKTAIESLTNIPLPANVQLVLDANYSGAGLAWKVFSEESKPLPYLLAYIQDRDLWRWELPNSREVNAYVGLAKKNIGFYHSLMRQMERDLSPIVMAGSVLLEQNNRHVESIVLSTKRKINILGHSGYVCNCPGQFAPEVGNELAKQSGTFGATWFVDSDGLTKWSLRSIGDFDVSAIAKVFGGGGHKNAAGFLHSGIRDGRINIDIPNYYGGSSSED